MREKDDIALNYIKTVMQSFAPFKTGNLSINSIRILSDERGRYVAIGGEIAPYAKILNDKGKHAGWIDNAYKFVEPTVRQIYSGEITEDDIAEITQIHTNLFAQTQQKFETSAQDAADKIRRQK